MEAGRRADLLILEADPTLDTSNTRKIHTVAVERVVLDRAALLNAPPIRQIAGGGVPEEQVPVGCLALISQSAKGMIAEQIRCRTDRRQSTS